MLYSPSKNTFYTESVHGENIPSDAVEISKDLYDSLKGKLVAPNANGMPVEVEQPIKTVYPQQVTRAQGKAALIRAGLWQGVVDFVDSISDPVEKAVAEVALNDTTHWQRSSPFLNSAAEALGLTDEQLDQLFIDASKIEL